MNRSNPTHVIWYGNYGWTSVILFFVVYGTLYLVTGAFFVYFFSHPTCLADLDLNGSNKIHDPKALRLVCLFWPFVVFLYLAFAAKDAIRWMFRLLVKAEIR